ncbi:MAG: serine/threonine-protein kinase [Planctomycetota bacterium]
MTTPGSDSSELYEIVVRCVAAYEEGGDAALDREIEAAGTLAESVRQRVASLRDAGLLQEPDAPDAIGPYRVLRKLGSGGMGTVYLCEQRSPLSRRVAVKVLRGGMDSRAVLARFALEREALAVLDHPGIARVFDAGATENGRPYLAMEFVPGRPLHHYCDERQLTTRERAALFARICDAVQHAHQKGIVHRDLKPSNILVVDRDGEPWPVVIDFGVAKSLSGIGASATLLTMPGIVVGTPEYMSPEQASMSLDVDTRSDVYSLGVVLYEMLTGALPIPRERFRGEHVARVLSEVDPPTPSTRLTSLGQSSVQAAQQRRTDISGLRRQLRGELDWITLRALEKDRNRRYSTVAELAQDVRRYLANEPVEAGPPSTWYRLRKACARNRLLAGASVAVIGAISIGLVTSAWFWRDAAASSRRSRDSLRDAMAAVSELVQVGEFDLLDIPHLTEVRAKLLERSVEFYERFLQRSDIVDPVLLPRVADAQIRQGRMLAELGRHDAAISALEQGIGRAVSLPAGGLSPALLGRGMLTLADCQRRKGWTQAAEDTLARAEQIFRSDAMPNSGEPVAGLVRVLLARSGILDRRSKSDALAVASEAVELARPFPEDQSIREGATLDLTARCAKARLQLDLGRREEAVPDMHLLLADWRRANQATQDAAARWRLAVVAGEIGALFAACDSYAQVLGVLDDGEASYVQLVEDHPQVVAYRLGLARTRLAKANALLRNWRFAEALATLAAAEVDCDKVHSLAPDDVDGLRVAADVQLSTAHFNVEGARQRIQGDMDKARAARDRARAILEALRSRLVDHDGERSRWMDLHRLDALLDESIDSPDSIRSLEEALRLAGEILHDEPGTVAVQERSVEIRSRLAASARRRGDGKAAIELLEPALAEHELLQSAASSRNLWFQRRRAIIAELVLAHAQVGNLAPVDSLLDEYLGLAANEDWAGRNELARLCARMVSDYLAEHPERQRILRRGRDAIRLAMESGDEFARRGGGGASPSMMSVMRARTWAILAELEQVAGDKGAVAKARGEVAACLAGALREAPSDKSAERVLETGRQWMESLVAADDWVGLTAAARDVVGWLDGRKSGLETVVRFLADQLDVASDRAAVLAVGREALQAAINAGLDWAVVQADPVLSKFGDH